MNRIGWIYEEISYCVSESAVKQIHQVCASVEIAKQDRQFLEERIQYIAQEAMHFLSAMVDDLDLNVPSFTHAIIKQAIGVIRNWSHLALAWVSDSYPKSSPSLLAESIDSVSVYEKIIQETVERFCLEVDTSLSQSFGDSRMAQQVTWVAKQGKIESLAVLQIIESQCLEEGIRASAKEKKDQIQEVASKILTSSAIAVLPKTAAAATRRVFDLKVTRQLARTFEAYSYKTRAEEYVKSETRHALDTLVRIKEIASDRQLREQIEQEAAFIQESSRCQLARVWDRSHYKAASPFRGPLTCSYTMRRLVQSIIKR